MDERLAMIRLAVAKNDSAFVNIAETVNKRLYLTALSYFGNEAMACDALDEAMFNAWKGISKLRYPEYFDTWITRILINCCKKIQRKQNSEVLLYSVPEKESEEYDLLPMQDAVARLPEKLRLIISLRFFSDYTIAETAAFLRIPENTVKTRQRRALALLKVELEDNNESH